MAGPSQLDHRLQYLMSCKGDTDIRLLNATPFPHGKTKWKKKIVILSEGPPLYHQPHLFHHVCMATPQICIFFDHLIW